MTNWTQVEQLKPEINKPIIWLMSDKKTEQEGSYHHNLWWTNDVMYVYYTPYACKYKK